MCSLHEGSRSLKRISMASYGHVAIIGNGGREHALALACAQAPWVQGVHLFGSRDDCEFFQHDTIQWHLHNRIGAPNWIDALKRELCTWAIIGPETLLALDLATQLREAGIACVGPSARLARLESDKVFAKSLFNELKIPTPKATSFDSYDALKSHIEENALSFPQVIKRHDLCGGKGVVIVHNNEELLQLEKQWAALAGPFLVEEFRAGVEFSFHVLLDEHGHIRLPLSRDFKKRFAKDQGPNTGGMGAICPPPAWTKSDSLCVQEDILSPLLQWIREQTLEKSSTGYRGVLYLGLMKSDRGLELLETNVRFGDPETQAILASTKVDWASILLTCAKGELRQSYGSAHHIKATRHVNVKAWVHESYPSPVEPSPVEIHCHNAIEDDFHSSNLEDPTFEIIRGNLHQDPTCANRLTGAGRILYSRSVGDSPYQAHTKMQRSMKGFTHNLSIRHDIVGWPLSYESAGVNDFALYDLVQSSLDSASARFASEDSNALLYTCDGLGTKTLLARKPEHYESLAADLFNHLTNDLIAGRAWPSAMLDTIVQHSFSPKRTQRFLGALSKQCCEHQVDLLGGESAIMPKLIRTGGFEVLGTMIGREIPELKSVASLEDGDSIVALPSNGLHTNGYSWINATFSPSELDSITVPLKESKRNSLGDILRTPHRSYREATYCLLNAGVYPKKIAHITGGGLEHNIRRLLEKDSKHQLILNWESFEEPTLYQWFRENLFWSTQAMRTTFNMGVGFVYIISQDTFESALDALSNFKAWKLGEIHERRV